MLKREIFMLKNAANFTLLFVLTTLTAAKAENTETEESFMEAKGVFEVKLEPEKDHVAPAGRMIIHKEYAGELAGTGLGQMLSKRTDSGVAIYFAFEEFTGTLSGKRGSFTLAHKGFMSSAKQNLEIDIVPGSGNGDLKDIEGSLDIIQEDGKHSYVLKYTL